MSDDPTLGGDPGYTPVRTSLPQILAEQANAAISKGADPKAVTARLGQMVAHLKAHPELDQMGMDAIGKGADPGAVTGRVWQMAQAEPGHGGGSSWGGPEDTNYSDGGTIQPSASVAMLNGIPFGLKTKAAGDALLRGAGNVVKGQPTHVGADYDTNIEALQHATQQYVGQHRVKGTLAEIAGGLIPAVATLGGSSEAQGGLSLGAKMLRGAGIGAATGAAYGASDAHGGPSEYASQMAKGAGMGALGGAVTEPLMAGASGLVKALGVPNVVSQQAGKVADRLEGGDNGGVVLPFLANAARSVSNATGTTGRANAEIGQAMRRDVQAGATRPALPSGIPSYAVDQGGPAVEGLAETIANSPSGAGRSLVTRTLEGRARQMPNAVQGAIHDATGVDPTAGLDPLRARIAERGRVAGELYNAAREATKGQPVQSPTLDTVLESPIGQQAFKWAKAQMENRGMALPTGEVPDEATQQALQAMGVPAEKATAAGVTTKELPDPETLHYMKRFLASAARLGLRDGQGGKLATEAQGALNQWGNIRGELPPIWRAADDAYAQHSKLIDLMDQGRNVYRAGINPAGRATKAAQNDVGAIGGRIANADEAGQAAGREGVGIAMQERGQKLGATVKSPGRLYGGPHAEATSLGFKTPAEAQSFQDLIGGWDQVAAQRERILGNSRTGIRRELAESRKPVSVGPLAHAMHGNFGSAARALVTGASNDAQRQSQHAVDEAIAQRLMSQQPGILQTALGVHGVRDRMSQNSRKLLAILGADATSSTP